jgi:hypothetical protein
LPSAEIRYYVEKISAPERAHPYGLEITIQTTAPIGAARIRLEFDGPIYDVSWPGFKIPGGIAGSFSGVIFNPNPRGNVYEFSFSGVIGGTFGPQSPLIIRVYGDHPLKLVNPSLTH